MKSYTVTDHLGSTSLTLDASGVEVARMGYKPWGETRYASGSSSTDYKFTGQMRLDIGIYFYGARNYDSLIGRFLSPDSIIPSAGNPMDWDRYAAMRNNPIHFIDPSGHISYTTDQCGPDGINCGGMGNSGDPAVVDPSPLTYEEEYSDDKGNTYDGYDMELLFNYYIRTPGYWNADGDFSLEEFIGLALLNEIGIEILATDLIIAVTAQQIWSDSSSAGGHSPYCAGDKCVNGAFEFLAAYSQSARGKVIRMRAGVSQLDDIPDYNGRNAWKIGQRVLHPVSSHYSVYSNDVPYHWGNNVDWNKKASASGIGPLNNELYYRGQTGGFIIYSMNQFNFWNPR